MYPTLMLCTCHVSFIHRRVDVSSSHHHVDMSDESGVLTVAADRFCRYR